MADKRILKKFKWFSSYTKELNWLEEMALKGWKLYDIRFGAYFYFKSCEPARLLYELDRFNLPKNPALKEIRHKEIFIGVAEDMGWSVITHDENQNYYFCKVYVEGEINELYNDEEFRKDRAKRYREFFREKAESLVKILYFFSIVFLALGLVDIIIGEGFPQWMGIFFMVYTLVALGLYFFMINRGEKYYLEFMRMKEGNVEGCHQEARKVVRKLILTNIRLKKYLSEMARKGWRLEYMTATRYFFISEDSTGYQYTMDSKYLTNKRRKALGRDNLKDTKDWIGMNNDWQIQSLKDAESKGWIFICALENRLVIYRSRPGITAQPLNDLKYDKRPRLISIIGEYTVYLILCGLIGGLAGGIIGAIVGH